MLRARRLRRPEAIRGAERQAHGRGRASSFSTLFPVVLALILASGILWSAGCSKSDDSANNGSSSSTTSRSKQTGDVQGQIGKTLAVGDVRVTVNALEATLNPSLPSQRISEQAPTPPAANESFYQAFVRVENLGGTPVRVDGQDFYCLVGNSPHAIDVTRSGPEARSLLPRTSVDLLLTFRGPAGFEPVLLYRPPWYDGTIRVAQPVEATPTTT